MIKRFKGLIEVHEYFENIRSLFDKEVTISPHNAVS